MAEDKKKPININSRQIAFKIPKLVHAPIGVQKGGPSYSPAMEVYTLHSIVMVLLYYIYLLGTYHWLLSLILSVHFRNLMLIT